MEEYVEPRLIDANAFLKHWNYANPRYRCSACKEKALWKNVKDELLSWHEVQALTPYCPHCGAEMDI